VVIRIRQISEGFPPCYFCPHACWATTWHYWYLV